MQGAGAGHVPGASSYQPQEVLTLRRRHGGPLLRAQPGAAAFLGKVRIS